MTVKPTESNFCFDNSDAKFQSDKLPDFGDNLLVSNELRSIRYSLSTNENTKLDSTILAPLWFCFTESDTKDNTTWESKRDHGQHGESRIIHSNAGKKVEEWVVKRNDAGTILSLEPQIGRESLPDKQNLNNARRSLFEKIELSKLDEGQKLQAFKAMQQLEEVARAGKFFGNIDLVRTDLAANYLHTERLLTSGASLDEVVESLKRPSRSSSTFIADCAGNFDSSGQPIKHQDGRENEIWNANLTRLQDKSVASFSLNGQTIEAWKISVNKDLIEFEPLIHKDPVPDREGLKEARNALLTRVQKSSMSPSEQLEFFKDVAHLEHRARCKEFGGNLEQTRKELTATYKQLDRMLDGSINGKVPLNERVILARQLAHQFADTQDIDQGMASDACRMSVAEIRLSVTRPSVVAKLVTDAALDGQVIFGNPGTKVALDQDSLKPASAFAIQFPRVEDERSFASQLFQLTCMNLLGKDRQVVREHLYYMNLIKNETPVKDYEKLVFKQVAEGKRDKDGKLHKKDNGLRVYGENGGKLQELTPGGKKREGSNQILLQACMSQYLLDLLDPGKHKDVVLAHKDALYYTRDTFGGRESNRGLNLFASPQDLEQKIADAKREGRLPLILASIDRTADPGDVPPEMDWNETNHVLTIRDYIPAKPGQPAQIVTDDQFGRSYDKRKMSVKELYHISIDEAKKFKQN